MKKSKRTTYISFGLVVGSIIGMFLDMYQIGVYGVVGLGIVFTPIIGLCIGAIICNFNNKKYRLSK
ncbi:hypothetical protein tinsulaeT_28000 [Thalassotalea insulae]|uniref:Uncharacterized protein n=1 Tax=Thalassotalea insulae TaxID=2056778 RepID=A0ABQ6GXI8_9GAMM|nr:hypothetical protein tinsulaeT_28000 [Thalassotalea insulae]